MKKLMFILLATVLALCASPAYAAEVPPLPHAFYGSLTIDGDPALAGTIVEARGTEVVTGLQGNPLTTVKPGEYGSASSLEQRLIVQGFIPDGAEIIFYVNDISTGQTYPFDSSETTRLDLALTVSEPEPEPEPTPAPSGGNGGGGGPSYSHCWTDCCGDTGKFHIDWRGKVIDPVTAGCKDSPLTITIDKGTIAKDRDGKWLSTLSVTEVSPPPAPPEGSNIIGLPIDLEPDGATFNPPVTLTWTYEPADLPDGVDPESLVLAYYDEDTQSWVELECVVDTETMTVTATVSHFTEFALLSPAPMKPEPPAPPAPKPPVVEPAPPAPAPTPPVIEPVPPKKKPPAPPTPPTPAPKEEPVKAVPPTPSFPWYWILVAGVVVALIIILLARRWRRD